MTVVIKFNSTDRDQDNMAYRCKCDKTIKNKEINRSFRVTIISLGNSKKMQ